MKKAVYISGVKNDANVAVEGNAEPPRLEVRVERTFAVLKGFDIRNCVVINSNQHLEAGWAGDNLLEKCLC
uniref:Uncharacterized protein n=1 Tax=Angiostrongylus cantonensis TaxID=6313 RepID=A0A0K0DH07_ANGCA